MKFPKRESQIVRSLTWKFINKSCHDKSNICPSRWKSHLNIYIRLYLKIGLRFLSQVSDSVLAVDTIEISRPRDKNYYKFSTKCIYRAICFKSLIEDSSFLTAVTPNKQLKCKIVSIIEVSSFPKCLIFIDTFVYLIIIYVFFMSTWSEILTNLAGLLSLCLRTTIQLKLQSPDEIYFKSFTRLLKRTKSMSYSKYDFYAFEWKSQHPCDKMDQ